MSILNEFEARLPSDLRKVFRSFESPIDIQRYLDGMPYIGEERDRAPLDVMRDRQCHCLDGGLFAALALRKIGDPGILIDMVPGKDAKGYKLDDDHVLAIFRRHGLWGAVSKSNYPIFRYREPVYRSLRELVMSFFELYISVNSIKALRAYTRPFDISRYDKLNYAWDEPGATTLYKLFYARKPVNLFSEQTEALLIPADKRAYESANLGVNWDWVYKP